MKRIILYIFIVLVFTIKVPVSIWNTIEDKEDFVNFVGTIYNGSKKNNCKRVFVVTDEDTNKEDVLFEFKCLEKIRDDM